MKSSDYAYLYRSLIERSVENYQIQYLARNYDFARESRVAALIVKEVNARMQEAEKQLGIQRAQPFHLYIKKRKAHLALPLFRQEYLEPILRGDGGFRASRRLAHACCTKACRSAGVKIVPSELLGMVDPDFFMRTEYRGRSNAIIRDPLHPQDRQWVESIRDQIEHLDTRSVFDRIDSLDTAAPVSLVNQLSQFVEREAGKGQVVAAHLVQELIALRNACCPRVDHLRSGEMPLLAISVNAHLSEEVSTRFRRMRPIILTVWTREELLSCPWDNPITDKQMAKRIVRVCFEAYRQGGLLSLMDLQWIFQISSTRISKLIRMVQKKARIVVPTPGTVLDSGRSMTHKDIIIALHLQGYSVREIARITYHSPRAIDSYIDTFESVLILQLYHVPKQLMARILRKGISLIEEHLEIAHEHFADENDMKRLLAWKEVRG